MRKNVPYNKTTFLGKLEQHLPEYFIYPHHFQVVPLKVTHADLNFERSNLFQIEIDVDVDAQKL